MGFIDKNITLKAYLTQKGKEEIIDGNGINITQFLLGDSDSNYTIDSEIFDVVDLSGRDDCLKGVSGDIALKYPVFFSGDTTPTLNFLFNDIIVTNEEILKENSGNDQIKITADFPMLEDIEINVQLSSLTQFRPSTLTYMGETKPFLNNNIIKFFIFQGETETDTLSIAYQDLPLVPSGTTLNSSITQIKIIDSNQPANKAIEDFNVILNGGLIPQITFSTRVQNANLGLNDGRIFIENIRNGQMPYVFSIIRNDNGIIVRNNVLITNINTTEVQNIQSGTYTVRLFDINGYVTERIVVVAEISISPSPLDFTIAKVRDAFDVIPINNGIADLISIQNGSGFPYELQISSSNGQFNRIFNVNTLPFRITQLAPNTYNIVLRKGSATSSVRQLVIGTQVAGNLIIEPIRSTQNINQIVGFRIRNVININNNPHSLSYLYLRIGTTFPRYENVLAVPNLSEGILTITNGLPTPENTFTNRFQNTVRFLEAETNREAIYILQPNESIITI